MAFRPYFRQMAGALALSITAMASIASHAQTGPALPDHVIEQFGEAPPSVDDPLSPALQFALRVAFIDSTTLVLLC